MFIVNRKDLVESGTFQEEFQNEILIRPILYGTKWTMFYAIY